jgi:proteic killer suppression protein
VDFRNAATAVRAASTVGSLRIPPGNRLEALSGDRAGQYSIRINEQYRLCFTFEDGAAANLEIVDYH